jgi:hypothetical protein
MEIEGILDDSPCCGCNDVPENLSNRLELLRSRLVP